MLIENWFWIGFAGGGLSLLLALIQLLRLLPLSKGEAPARGLADALGRGTNVYLKWQLLLSVGFLLLTLLLFIPLYYGYALEPLTIGAFLSGSLCSLLVGIAGAKVTAAAGPRAADAAGRRLDKGVNAALRAGSAVSFLAVGLALLHVTGWFFLLRYQFSYGPDELALSLLPLCAGSGLMTLLFHMGSLFSGSAGLAQQLVDREQGLSPDSPQNPAAIALRVGHGVGAAARTAAGLHWGLECALLAAFALGAAAFTPGDMGWNAMLFPLAIVSAGVLCSLLGSLAIPARERGDRYSLPWTLRLSQLLSAVLLAVVSFPLSYLLTGAWDLCWTVTIGLLAGLLTCLLGEYFTADTYKPARSLADAAELGAAPAVAGGLGSGFAAGVLPGVLAAGAFAAAFCLLGGVDNLSKGLYGAALAALGMAAPSGVSLAAALCGPVGDNAAHTLSLIDDGEAPRRRADALAALGASALNGGKCLDASLTALAGFSLLACLAALLSQDGVRPLLLCGALLGGLSALLFLGLLLRSLRRTSLATAAQAGQQFRDADEPVEPDYYTCLTRCATRSLLGSLLPFLLALLTPLGTGLLLGPQGLLGFLAALLLLALLLGPAFSLSGGVLGGARRYVESGKRGGRGSPCHRSTVQAEEMLAPLRDVAGPALVVFCKAALSLSLIFYAAIPLFGLLG